MSRALCRPPAARQAAGPKRGVFNPRNALKAVRKSKKPHVKRWLRPREVCWAGSAAQQPHGAREKLFQPGKEQSPGRRVGSQALSAPPLGLSIRDKLAALKSLFSVRRGRTSGVCPVPRHSQTSASTSLGSNSSPGGRDSQFPSEPLPRWILPLPRSAASPRSEHAGKGWLPIKPRASRGHGVVFVCARVNATGTNSSHKK